jgi:hypothetical protein
MLALAPRASNTRKGAPAEQATIHGHTSRVLRSVSSSSPVGIHTSAGSRS